MDMRWQATNLGLVLAPLLLKLGLVLAPLLLKLFHGMQIFCMQRIRFATTHLFRPNSKHEPIFLFTLMNRESIISIIYNQKKSVCVLAWIMMIKRIHEAEILSWDFIYIYIYMKPFDFWYIDFIILSQISFWCLTILYIIILKYIFNLF